MRKKPDFTQFSCTYTKKLKARFWSKVDKQGTDDCWNWTASCSTAGHGQIAVAGQTWGAHIISWLLAGKCLEDGDLVLHTCHNARCVNPEHLKTGTHKENFDDMAEAGNWNPQKPKPPALGPLLKYKPRKATMIGEQQPSSKLTEEQVRQIRHAYDHYPGGISQSALAETYGVSQKTIHKVLTGKTWKHVT